MTRNSTPDPIVQTDMPVQWMDRELLEKCRDLNPQERRALALKLQGWAAQLAATVNDNRPVFGSMN